MPPKVLDSLENLAQSLHDETLSSHFEAVKAGCDAEAARSKAEGEALAEAQEVAGTEATETTAKVAELDQAIVSKKLAIEEVNGQITEQEQARDAARTEYEDEAKTLLASRAELNDALAKHAEEQFADKSSLAQLRKLSHSLQEATRAPSFVQLDLSALAARVRSPELVKEQATLNTEIQETRKAFDAKLAEFTEKLAELHKTKAAEELDLSKLLPAKAAAQSRSSGSGARTVDIERTHKEVKAAEEAHLGLCKHMLDELEANEEKRAGVEHDLAGAIESLSSSVFTSLVEKSAAALDMPSFVQLKTRMLRTEMFTAMDLPGLVATAAAGLLQRTRKEVLQFVPERVEAAVERSVEAPAFVQQSLAVRTGVEADPFLAVKQKIRMLIDSLRNSNNKDVDLADWCTQQEEANARDIVKKEQENDINAALIIENQGREAELGEQRGAVEQAERDFTAASVAVGQTFKEHVFRMGEQRKAHALAAEVLADAAKLVREFYGVAESTGSFLQQTPSEAGQKEAAEHALSLLETATQGIKELISDAETQETVGAELKGALDKKAEGLVRARKQELNSLEVMESALADARMEAEQAKETGVTAVAEMKKTKEQVAQECASPDDGQDAAQRRQDEIAAMQDAVKVLEGEDIPVMGLLQAHGKSTPLDRAAAALGIRVRPQ